MVNSRLRQPGHFSCFEEIFDIFNEPVMGARRPLQTSLDGTVIYTVILGYFVNPNHRIMLAISLKWKLRREHLHQRQLALECRVALDGLA